MAKMDDLVEAFAHHEPSPPRHATGKGRKRDDRTDR
jgi:hypothetical protein